MLVLYDDTASIQYMATLTQADTMTVLNTLDSIKVITLTALDGSTPLPADPLHNKRIILSKTHGFVQRSFGFAIVQYLSKDFAGGKLI